MDYIAKTFIIVFSISLFLISCLIFFEVTYRCSECFKEIAREVCQEKGGTFDGVFFGRFGCKIDLRSYGVEYYNFLDEEIERCRR
ncbi:hypothetical protein ES702_04465 [subsurface metagenome]